MTCLLIFLGAHLAVIHCTPPPRRDVWIEPERVGVVALYLPRPPKWSFDA